MDDTCAVQVVIHMLDSRLEINVSRFLGTYQSIQFNWVLFFGKKEVKSVCV